VGSCRGSTGLADVPYRVVVDATDVADGLCVDLAVMFLDQYHEVYGTPDDQARAVIVMASFGTPLALGDALWDRYAIGRRSSCESADAPAGAP